MKGTSGVMAVRDGSGHGRGIDMGIHRIKGNRCVWCGEYWGSLKKECKGNDDYGDWRDDEERD